ncbi:hypothetical protein CHUAL_011848 [Chamberlinius hualienensis]
MSLVWCYVILLTTVTKMTMAQVSASPSTLDAWYLHILCKVCTPYTSAVCCAQLKKCCFSECPSKGNLSCSLLQNTCHFGRCPAGMICCPGNLFFCCVPKPTTATTSRSATT